MSVVCASLSYFIPDLVSRLEGPIGVRSSASRRRADIQSEPSVPRWPAMTISELTMPRPTARHPKPPAETETNHRPVLSTHSLYICLTGHWGWPQPSGGGHRIRRQGRGMKLWTTKEQERDQDKTREKCWIFVLDYFNCVSKRNIMKTEAEEDRETMLQTV